eukprot:8672899-Pyramimonas_sp.AAC.2
MSERLDPAKEATPDFRVAHDCPSSYFGQIPTMSPADGQSYHSCSTTDQLKDMRIILTSTWRLYATGSRINTGCTRL